ncbi:MAG TPA: VIT domain-containing protein [Gemmatimonadales bacterium]|jgi:Ca-activated chloride channel family protein|nr:VIT domain-containing protein [Gemmatimonadales bacterium]
MSRAPLALLLLAAPLSSLGAQGWIDIERPAVPIRGPAMLVRVGSSVRATVDGRVARFEVEERFRNAGPVIAEGTYLYPLPGEAVFTEFSLFQGEKELKGEMMSAEQARTIYEGIVRKLRDPALLTLVGHGLIRAQVFPVQPGETRTVTLRFTQLLAREGDALRLKYAAGDRGDAPVTMRLEIRREAEFATAYSPTHQITDERRDGTLRLTVAEPVRGDVEVVLPFRRGLVGGTVLTHAEPGDAGFALLFLAPPASEDTPVVGRDLTMVVDVSGSMSGEKMDQARAALRQALSSLGARDRFRLIAFSNAVREFREGFTPATREALTDARRFVDDLNANGGTNLAGAVQAALAERPDAERLALVLLLTDGIPSVGEQAPDRIAAEAAGRIGRARIFTVGVGSDVNTYLLDRLAVEGRGSATYVPPGADVGDAVGGVMSKLARPALVDLRIVDSPVRFEEQAPAALPDLFYGEELVVLARYRGEGSGPVVIEGTRNGRRERFTIAAQFSRLERDHDYIPVLWASRRIGELTRQIRLEGSSPTLTAQVRDLGLRYGIITEYTSYLVQEPGVVAANAPMPMPSGAAGAREMTGDAAFKAARASSLNLRGSTLAAADQAASMRLEEIVVSGVNGRDRSSYGTKDVRRAGGRLFAQRDGVWTDVAHRDSLKVTTIAPFSNAYFAVVRARPALRAALGIGTPVVVAGRRASLKVAEGGLSEWTAGALERFLQEFDGR